MTKALAMPDSWGLDAFGSQEFAGSIESQSMVETRSLRHDLKRKLKKLTQRETAMELVAELPAKGETIHFISNGSFDYWDVIAAIAKRLGPCHFHGSTWTMNRRNAQEILDNLDSGAFLSATLITGIYFKRRETAVYSQIATGLLTRGQKFRALETHAKVALLTDGVSFFTFEGSANFTANPRIEQNILANDEQLHGFHRDWIDEAATADQ